MLNGFFRRLSYEHTTKDDLAPTNHSTYSLTLNGTADAQTHRTTSMRARAGSIRLPLYKDSQTNGFQNGYQNGHRPVSPDSHEYRSGKPHSKGRPYSRWRPPIPWISWGQGSFVQLLKLALAIVVLVVLVVSWLWEVQVEVFFYSRRWIDTEVLTITPLAGCFDHKRISAHYNFSRTFEPKQHEVQAGLPLRMGLDCYDLAATIQGIPSEPPDLPPEKIYYHAYWRADLLPFEERQEWMLKSFFATQDLSRSILILWSNSDLRRNSFIIPWLARYPDAFQLRIIDINSLASGTALEGSPYLNQKDSKAWVDGDILRLLVVWAYGGVWVDMDSLLTRDLRPLLEHEFVTQWDCYDKIYRPFNGALMHFRKHSPYLCEAFHIMATGTPPHPGSVDWGSLLYLKLYRRLLAAGIPPFKILPFCFTDGRSCRLDNRLPDPFEKDPRGGRWPLRGPRIAPTEVKGMDIGGPLDLTLRKVFSVHLHNQWEKRFPAGGWVERLLLDRYERILGATGMTRHH